MTEPAVRWMKSIGLMVKLEVISPWGMCDLVGVSLNPERVAQRLELKQTHAVNSMRRATMLLNIPDAKSRKSTTFEKIAESYLHFTTEEEIAKDIDRLITERFVVRTPSGRLQKVNGWMPLHDRLVALELKMSRIEEAMRQSFNNLGFASESYVGFPSDVAHRINDKPKRWQHYLDAGVGLLSVSKDECVVLRPGCISKTADPVLQFYSVEKFWGSAIRTKDNSSSVLPQ